MDDANASGDADLMAVDGLAWFEGFLNGNYGNAAVCPYQKGKV
jgi:hypothetical protein